MGIATSVVAMLDVVAADGDWQLLGDQVLPIVRLDRCVESLSTFCVVVVQLLLFVAWWATLDGLSEISIFSGY